MVLIEQVELGNRSLLAKREQFWQNQLRAFVENGRNAMCIRRIKGTLSSSENFSYVKDLGLLIKDI